MKKLIDDFKWSIWIAKNVTSYSGIQLYTKGIPYIWEAFKEMRKDD